MRKYISIIAAIFIVAGIVGCGKDFLSLEQNPNEPAVTTPQLMLSGAEKISADIVNTDYSQYGVWGGYWTSSGNYVPDPTLQQYQFTNANFTACWTDLYANATNYNNLVNISSDPTLVYFKAIGMIMKVYDFQQLVDNFNDVPYKQAFQPSTIMFPAYDSGKTVIYPDLMTKLDTAISLIDNASSSAISPKSNDIIFAGNMSSWAMFANTLKLRLAIRQSNLANNKVVPGSTFAAELAKTSGDGYLDDNTQALVNPVYQNVAGKESPFYGFYGFDATGNATGSNSYYRANSFCVQMLQQTNDTRLPYFYAPTVSGTYRGNDFGNTNVFLANSYTSAIGPGLLQSPTQSAVLLSSAEACFLLAEGDLNGYISYGTSAQDYYQRGITASFIALGVGGSPSAGAAAATTYYKQPIANVSWTSSTNKEKAIITQKWLSLNGTGNLEAYNEYRRTGYPVLPQSLDPAAISATLPTRIYYPQSEANSNGANLAAEGTINPFTSKIFWAQ